jgi:hypothetical protein
MCDTSGHEHNWHQRDGSILHHPDNHSVSTLHPTFRLQRKHDTQPHHHRTQSIYHLRPVLMALAYCYLTICINQQTLQM